MKKTFSVGIILILSMVLLLTSACTPKTVEPDEPTYPTKTIQFIVPWSPGGGSDVTMRIVGSHLSEVLGQPIPIVNKPGASGTVGLLELTEMPADGYYIGMIHEGLLVAHHTGVTEINYDSFIPIASMTDSPQYLAARSDAPFDTVEEFVEWAQENSGDVKYGTTIKAIPHAWGAILAKSMGTEFKYISYEGTGERIQALAGGFIDVAIVDYPSTNQFVENGNIKYIAACSAERLPQNPDIPTLKEKGYDFNFSVKRGIVVPEGTPEEVVTILENALEEVATSAEFIAEVEQAGSEVAFMGKEDYTAYLDKNNAEIADVAADIIS